MECFKIDNYTAKEAMTLAVEYLKKESIQTIEMITLGTLKYCKSDSYGAKAEIISGAKREWDFSDFDITFAENKTVLQTLGVADETLLKEAESQLFMKMFLHYLHKNRVKVFLIAENEEKLVDIKEYFRKHLWGIKIVETATIETHGISDDMILNRINGVEAECILAALSTPRRQEFIVRNRLLIHANLWLGLGTDFFKKGKPRRSIGNPIIDFIKKSFFVK